MKLTEMTKEELELLSYTKIAKMYLEENKKTMNTADLFREICNLLDLGEAEYQDKIADFFESLTTSKDFILLNDININSVVFMYVKDKENIKNLDIEDLNKMNIYIHERMLDEGKYHLHKFSLPDDKGVLKKGAIVYPLRFMSGNPNITEDVLNDVLDYIRNIAKEYTK